MAKKTSRSEANDTTAPVAEKRKMKNPGKLNSAVEGPEAISRQLDAAADQVQQAPGDAIAASEGRLTDRTEPTEQDIRDRAYLMYLERGAHDGQDFDDWLRAEGELKRRR